jgi:RNA polymerase primary sigma factor
MAPAGALATVRAKEERPVTPDTTLDRTARERRLVRAAQRGDRRARERLVGAHLGLVRSIARRYRGLGLPLEDLVQEGSIGLLDAIARYDPRSDVELGTFAGWRVRRAILNALTEQSRIVRLPKQVVESRRALARAESRLAAATGHVPTDAELSRETGICTEAVVRGRTAVPAAVSVEVGGVVADPAARDPEREAVLHEEERLLVDALAHLPARQREVVSRHFGLGGPPTPIADVAAGLCLSRQRTRAIERDALSDLRTTLERAGLRR